MERHLSPLPLEGIRVVDLTIWVQGPLAAAILADFGAEVIKIEKPGQGDFARGSRRMFNQSTVLPDGRSLMWEMSNRNKRAIAVNLYQPKGQEVFYRLIEQSHVMITNLNPQALLHMGADKETVLKHNSDIIYAHSTGFGPRGPNANDPCQDITGMARSGFLFLNATPARDPVYPVGGLSDVMSATMLAFGVTMALLGKERTGKNAAVYTSQLGTMMWQALMPIGLFVNSGREFPPFDRTKAYKPLMNIYKCADGEWFAVGILLSERFWPDFCMVMDLPDLEHDPRFTTEDMLAEHRQDLIAIVDRAFASKPRAEWERRFRERGLLCSVVNRYSDLPADPQVQANEYITALDNGLQTVAVPIELEGVQPLRQGAPELGKDTDDILQEVCGYTWEEVVAMKADEVVW